LGGATFVSCVDFRRSLSQEPLQPSPSTRGAFLLSVLLAPATSQNPRDMMQHTAPSPSIPLDEIARSQSRPLHCSSNPMAEGSLRNLLQKERQDLEQQVCLYQRMSVVPGPLLLSSKSRR
jgi:hypothetical protein